jgi:hypothetical protein
MNSQNFTTRLWSAMMFILSGLIFLAEEFTGMDLWSVYWPILVITTGLIILWEAFKLQIKN